MPLNLFKTRPYNLLLTVSLVEVLLRSCCGALLLGFGVTVSVRFRLMFAHIIFIL